MKKVVTDLEILDFAEGMALDGDTEEALISLLSGSLEFRQELENYRRDLALADHGIPQIPLTLDIARELPALAKKAMEKRYRRIYSPAKFFHSRELLIVAGFLLAMLLLVGIYLWLWAQKN